MTVFDFVERFILFVIPGVIAYSIFCYLTGKKPLADLLSVSYVFIASIFSFIVGNFLLQLVNFFPCIEFQLVEVTQILSGNNGSLSVAGIISATIAAIILTFIAVFVWDQNLLFRFANFLNLVPISIPAEVIFILYPATSNNLDATSIDICLFPSFEILEIQAFDTPAALAYSPMDISLASQ